METHNLSDNPYLCIYYQEEEAQEISSSPEKVQLLPSYDDIWVSRAKLMELLQDAADQPTENAPLFVLRRLIPLVFTVQELAVSRG